MKLKNFMYRGVHGWCPEDVWNLDVYLARVIAESIKYLEKHTISYPNGMTFKQWKKILNQISKDIRIKEIDEEFYTLKNQRKAYKKQQEALKLFVTYFNTLWD